MFGLLYKDLVILKKDLINIVVTTLFFSIPLFMNWGNLLGNEGGAAGLINGQVMAFVIMPVFAYFCIFLCISLVQGSIFAQDERKVWSSYITASPLGAKGQVLSKYYLTIVLSLAGCVWGMVCDEITSAIIGVEGSARKIYMTLFFIQVLLRAIEMPFLIRFGQKNGKIYKVLLMIGIVFAAIVYALFGKLPEFASFDECMDWLIRVLGNQQKLSAVKLGVVSIFPVLSLFCYYLSYKVSCRLYRKGVESYDA